MQHLMIETIARLVDEAPTDGEAGHLAECDECRTTLEAMRADAVALRNLPMIEPPPTEWPEIEKQLLAEGLIRRYAGASAWKARALRLAASIALFVVGGASGVAWTQARVGGSPSLADVRPATGAGAPALIAATEPATPEETYQLYRQAEALYFDALARVTDLDDNRSGDPVARLVVLESIASITRSALDQAPADPVLNGYHLTALAQREATIRQIAASKSGRWF